MSRKVNHSLPRPDPKRRPVHPGEILRDDVLPATGRSVAETSTLLGISEACLAAILAEQEALSPAIADRLGELCGNGPNLWIKLQANYDEWVLRNSANT